VIVSQQRQENFSRAVVPPVEEVCQTGLTEKPLGATLLSRPGDGKRCPENPVIARRLLRLVGILYTLTSLKIRTSAID
jgi:hypothetical protein